MGRKICSLDVDFQRCIVFHKKIEIWIAGALETIGRVESYTDKAIKVDGDYYLRENCEFFHAGDSSFPKCRNIKAI